MVGVAPRACAALASQEALNPIVVRGPPPCRRSGAGREPDGSADLNGGDQGLPGCMTSSRASSCGGSLATQAQSRRSTRQLRRGAQWNENVINETWHAQRHLQARPVIRREERRYA
jgi:hypothetical protein